MAIGDKSHDTVVKSNAASMQAVRSSSLGGSAKPFPQFGITKMPKFGITQTMRSGKPSMK